MDNFQKTSRIANDLAKDFFKKFNYESTKDEFDVADFYITVKGNKWIGEIKNRNAKAIWYNDFIMELHKFNGLKDRMKLESCTNMLYVNFFGDVCMIWQYSDIIKYGRIEDKMCAKYSAVQSGYVSKQVIMLPKVNATIYHRNSVGDWIKQVNNK